MDKYNFTFCHFDIDYTEDLVNVMRAEVESVPLDMWHFNEFRGCLMLSFYNPAGMLGKVTLGRPGEFKFTEAANLCPITQQFIEANVLPWMIPHGRVTILRTPDSYTMKTHIDCSAHEVGTYQHKWRFVLKGDIEQLYFLDTELEKNYIPPGRCYVLDGGHPHCIEKSVNEKITICVGNPWNGAQLNNEYTSRLMLDDALYVPRPVMQDAWIDPILRK